MRTIWTFVVLSIWFAYAAWSGKSSDWGSYWLFFIAGGVVFGISNFEDREANERDKKFGDAYASHRAVEQELRNEEFQRIKKYVIAEYLKEQEEEQEAEFFDEHGCSSDEYLLRLSSSLRKHS